MTDNIMNLYVSPDGNDNWSGTAAYPSADNSDGPFATVAGARDAIRREGRHGGVTIHIADGVYELSDTLLFTPRDSGTIDNPVRYIAMPGATPVISGGRRITGWQEIQHNDLRCWVAELDDVKSGEWNFTRLYVNSSPRQRTRLPQSGFYHFTGVDGHKDTGFKWCHGPESANFAPGDIRQWHNWQDAEVISYQLWFDTHHRIKAIDENAGVVKFHTKSLGSLRDERGEFARYFIENVFEALDTPGQWYLDRSAGKLYYLPMDNETPETTIITAPRLSEIMRVQGEDGQCVSHLHFENITFAHQQWVLPLDCPGYIQAAYGVPGAIILRGAEKCVFYGCTVTHINGYGIEVLAGSTENIIAACMINDAGGGGVKIGHEELTPHESPVGEHMTGGFPACATTVADCVIRDCGHIFPSAIGIWVGNSGWNRLLNNRIFNCNYTGISCGWTWGYTPTRTVCNLIENNHIHHINDSEILSDNGGIYTLGQQPGTVLRGNVIHDISCYGYGAWGIYPDEGSSEMLVENNLICGTKKASYSTHYGRDNLVKNNIFALSQNDHLCLGKRELHRSTIFRGNVVVSANGNINGGAWDTAQYTVENNLFWSLDGTPFSFNGIPLADLQNAGQNTGAIVADPLFADAIGGDFSLRADSPAQKIGFNAFDWRAAGPRMTTERKLSFGEYLQSFPLPSLDMPVIRTKIELLTPPKQVKMTGNAEFAVTISNVGRTPGNGSISLKSGPQGISDSPDVELIQYSLAPGEIKIEKVKVSAAKNADVIWLESEPNDNMTIPTRAIVFDADKSEWMVSRVNEGAELRDVSKLLADADFHGMMDVKRLAAKVKLAVNTDNLIFLAEYHQKKLKPEKNSPWTGTAIEIMTIMPPEPDMPVDHPQKKCQVFIVPDADGATANGLLLSDTGDGVVPAPEIKTSIKQTDYGYEITAVIPWKLLGHDTVPAKTDFELIVDSMNETTGQIIQTPVFDLPSDGWRKLCGKLVVGN